jgi:hypothetical protein
MKLILILLINYVTSDIRSKREDQAKEDEKMQSCMLLTRARINQDSVISYNLGILQ